MARLTTIGESLVAAAVGVGPELEITKFVFANIPGLVHTDEEPADEPLPAPAHVVLETPPTSQGIIDDNRVTYAKMLSTEVGDFSFNWIGLVYTHPVDGDQLVMFAYVPLTQKVKTAGATVGNVIVRNMVIEHLGIANAVPIVVPAESWMYDFSAEIAAITAELNDLKERATHNLVHNPNNYTAAGAAQREIIVFDQGQSKTVTLDAANLTPGDVIEVQKLAKAGRIDIVGTVNIVLPNGVSELNHWLPAGVTGTLFFECVAANQLRYAGGILVMDLSLLGGSGGMGLLWLAPGNIIGPRSSGGGIFENAVTVSGLDISGAVMTEAFSADVDDGEILAIRSLSVGSMPTAAATFDYELEIDGEVVASKSIASLTNSSVYILGTAVSESSFTANVAFNVGVKSNVKLRVKRPAGIAVTVSMLLPN